MSLLNAPHFTDENEARKLIEGIRWPNGPVCGRCSSQKFYPTKREGRFRCAAPACRKDFTVTTGTVMESSHIKLHHWMAAFYLMSSSKKGISAHQLHRTLGITYKSAWFLAHRVREAMRAGGLVPPAPLGGTVEIDETYHGKAETPRPRNKYLPPPTKGGKVGPGGKRTIISLVERGGSVRSFHVAFADKATVNKIIDENVSREARIYTDESRLYGDVKVTWEHDTVRHSAGEYVRGSVHTNTIEGIFSIFKRGMRGVYQLCAEKHLHRYLAEYDFRYNHRVKLGFNDMERTLSAVKGAEGKRLTYRQPHSA